MESQRVRVPPDGWSKWGWGTDIPVNFLSTGFAVGEAIDLVATELFGAQKYLFELSPSALLFGIAIGAYAAVGSAYVHRERNIKSQSQSSQHSCPPDCTDPTHSHPPTQVSSAQPSKHSHHHHSHAHGNEHGHAHGVYHDDEHAHHAHGHDDHDHDSANGQLSGRNSFFFQGDKIAHTSGFASGFTFLLNEAVKNQFISPDISLKIILQFLFIVIAHYATKADVRSCKNNLITGNTHSGCGHSHGKGDDEGEGSMIFTNVITGLTSVPNTFYCASVMVDNVINFILYELGKAQLNILFWGLTWPGLIVGAIAAIFTIGGVISHRVLNLHDDGTALTPDEQKQPLKKWQYLSLAGDGVSHTFETLNPIIYISNILLGSSWVKPLVQFGGTLFAMSTAVPDVRGCMKGMKKMNYTEMNPAVTKMRAS
jgi:hypothetical protein